jgi:hypothetical protein
MGALNVVQVLDFVERFERLHRVEVDHHPLGGESVPGDRSGLGGLEIQGAIDN